jgi:Protein of unknown function (DUF3572)
MTAQESADAMALQAFGWLLEDPALRDAFLNETGVSPSDLPHLVKTRRFLAAVMDFLLADDRRVLDFCASAGLTPASALKARSHLPGGDLPHWT